MDSALLKEREAFKRRAMASTSSAAAASAASAKRAKAAQAELGAASATAKARAEMAAIKAKSAASSSSNTTSTSSAAFAFKFGVLAKIVRHMRSRHMEGDDHALKLSEVLDETHQTDISNKVKLWLANEALLNNPRITVSKNAEGEDEFIFKPPYPIRNKKALVKLLRHHDLKGLGGIFMEDVVESLPKAEKIIRQLTEEDKVIVVTRSLDKKKVLFYHDHTSDFDIDEEFRKLWRSVAVDNLDDLRIEEYLEKQGIKSMQEQRLSNKSNVKKLPVRKKPNRRRFKGPKDNEHMSDVLKDYSDGITAEKADK